MTQSSTRRLDLVASRSLDDLEKGTRLRALLFLEAAADAGVVLLVTCTLRTADDQRALYAIGRTVPGRIVTNAKPGQSWHEARPGEVGARALDVVPLRSGKPVWGTAGADGELWARVGALGESAGLEWAGRWRTFREFPHFQYRG